MVTSSDNKIFYCSYVVLLSGIIQVCFQVPHVEGRSFMPEKGISTMDIEQPRLPFLTTYITGAVLTQAYPSEKGFFLTLWLLPWSVLVCSWLRWVEWGFSEERRQYWAETSDIFLHFSSYFFCEVCPGSLSPL